MPLWFMLIGVPGVIVGVPKGRFQEALFLGLVCQRGLSLCQNQQVLIKQLSLTLRVSMVWD